MTKSRTNADNVTADIAGITAGTGITGGGTSGTVTITNDMATTIAAKGDLLAGTANDAYSAITVGANGTVLKANSATATGLEWGTAGGGGKSFALLNAGGTALSGSTTTISSLSGYDQFLILMKTVSGTNDGPEVRVRFNSDSGNNYTVQGGFVRATSTHDPSGMLVRIDDFETSGILWTRGTSGSDSFHACANMLVSGANTSGVKIFQASSGASGGGNFENQLRAFGGVWNNSAVISSISFIINFGTFDFGTVYIYGAV